MKTTPKMPHPFSVLHCDFACISLLIVLPSFVIHTDITNQTGVKSDILRYQHIGFCFSPLPKDSFYLAKYLPYAFDSFNFFFFVCVCVLGHIATEKMTVLQYYHLLKRLYE